MTGHLTLPFPEEVRPVDDVGYALDENKFLRLQLTAPSAPGGPIKAHLYSLYAGDSPLVKNILPMLSIESHGKDGAAVSTQPEGNSFDIPPSADGSFSLKINKAKNNATWADFTLKDGQITSHSHRKLIVSETQIIGRYPQTEYPAAVDYNGIQTPLVDQHTHLSAQINSADLIEIGLKHDIYYPISILNQLGIKYPPEHENIKPIPKLKFLPYARQGDADEKEEPGVRLRALEEPSVTALKNAMGLSPEGQSTVEDMEKSYFHRQPFTKDLDLLPDILHKIAEDYKKQGVRYAELSTNAVLPSTNKDGTLNLSWLKKVHEIMSADDMNPFDKKGELRNDRVLIRFRPGLPRNVSDTAFQERVEKYKRIAASPYVAGPDILGFEMNKTNDMKQHLDDLATWMSKHQPNDSIQIHAGENSKNPQNVREAILLAKEHGIRVLIGHAIYGIDKATLKLAKEVADAGKLMIQFNFISNLAGNNIDFPHDVHVADFFKEKIPCFNNSDGAGFYYADAKQTAMMAAQCGFTPKNFDAIRRTEEDYIGKQGAIFRDKAAALAKDKLFFENASIPLPPIAKKPDAALQAVHRGDREEDLSPYWQEQLSTRRPLFFAGAGGSGWKEMPAAQKKEFISGFKMLLEHLDSKEVYFLKGRTKVTGGIGQVMVNAIGEYNDVHRDKPFIIGTLLAENESIDNHGEPGNFTIALPNTTLLSLPSATAQFLARKKGAAFFVGGRQITRNFIEEFRKHDIPFGLMDEFGMKNEINPFDNTKVLQSASSSKARVYKDKTFTGAIDMVKYAFKHVGLSERFAHAPDDEELEKKYLLLQSSKKGTLSSTFHQSAFIC